MTEQTYKPPRQYRSSTKKYRLFPITLAGILVYALALFLLGLLWTFICFALIREPSEMAFVGYIIYFLALAAGCCTAAVICRGTSLVPVAVTALFAIVSSLVLSGFDGLSWLGLLLKLVLSTAVALLADLIARNMGRKENNNINLRGELRF